MKIWVVAGALLVLAIPQAAEAKRFRFSSGSSKAAVLPKPTAATPAAAASPTAPSRSIWPSAPGAAPKPVAAPNPVQANSRPGAFVFVSTGGGAAAATEQQPGQTQPQSPQQRATGAPLVQSASAAAESVPRSIPVPVLGQPQAQAARPPGFEVVR